MSMLLTEELYPGNTQKSSPNMSSEDRNLRTHRHQEIVNKPNVQQELTQNMHRSPSPIPTLEKLSILPKKTHNRTVSKQRHFLLLHHVFIITKF